MRMQINTLLAALLLPLCPVVLAQAGQGEVAIEMKAASETGAGASLGKVTVRETQYGVVFTPALTGLQPGVHGFHVHENPSCDPKDQGGKMVAALAAGGHYDPAGTKKHGTPWGDGHLGDLPALFVDASGNANNPVLAPRMKMSDVKGRALMVHAGGDNHADHPAPLGGGGARVACGVIQ